MNETEALITQAPATDKRVKEICLKALSGNRISPEEGIYLFEHGDVSVLGITAHAIREKKHGRKVFYNRNFHIEPTNVCVYTCHFCSYSRQYKHREEGWELSLQQMLDKVKEYDGKPVTEVHIVGGVHPKLNLEFFCELLRLIKQHRPELHIKAFTAVELHYMFRKAGYSLQEGLLRLKEAGLDSLPGGGAEIFDEQIRNQICADKCNAEEWLAIHQAAHKLGMHSNATMLYGHLENYGHRIDHMERLRLLQDKTGGFNTFIPLKFRNQNNAMSHLPEVTMVEDLKNYAVARIYLDNFAHLKTYWPMIGKATAQVSLSFGVDDLDGTIDDSTKIYSMAGAEEQNPSMTTEEIRELITAAGFEPVERDTLYKVIEKGNSQAETESLKF
jgi:aminodeoxyfutalosine synthase